jgi:hypothetical protein
MKKSFWDDVSGILRRPLDLHFGIAEADPLPDASIE